MPLPFNLTASFQPATLQQLDTEFLDKLRQHTPQTHKDLLACRAGNSDFSPQQISEIILAAAPVLDEFLADLFGIRAESEQQRREVLKQQAVFQFKKMLVQRRARRMLAKVESFPAFAELDAWLQAQIGETQDRELAVAQLAVGWLAEEKQNTENLEKLAQWCTRVLAENPPAMRGWASFHLPRHTDHAHLVPLRHVPNDPLHRLEGDPKDQRQRVGFGLTDPRMELREVLDEVHYCIYCHDHDGDFCSKGFPEKKGQPELGLKTDPLGVTLTGCPLDEKISEMHRLKRDGYVIAPLAVVMIDNPLCPITGHRICNDCMKSCIYQKQSPVDIPQIETRVLTDVLALPWGVEIYDLLTRWNPLRRRQWLPKPYNGNKILIAGQGPAGITLAHYLLMEGCAVVGIEGLKIEPLPQHLLHQPVRDWKELEEPLDRRVMTGFGGVAEYGITVRWDKNFLKLVYLSLARRPYFQVYGGVRFGGTLTVEDAWQLGFDHVSIAVGAGLPQALPIPGSLAPGMRQASDFLMALQLTGAAKADSLANLQVRLPAVIIGGGLTGVDTATEVQAYYLIQIEKILCRYETLAQTIGEDQIRAGLDAVSLEILEEFLQHGRELREERKNAERENRPPDTNALLRRWGGVTVAYRRAMQESPAYTRNHEELSKALEEGIYYAEGLEPKAARLDRYGHVVALACQRRVRDGEYGWRLSEEETVLPARSIFVATGAKPNVAYEFEHKGHFQRDGFQYVPHHALGGRLQPLPQAKHCKEPDFGAFTSYMQISPAPPFTKGGEEKSPPFTKGGSENTPPLKKGAGGDFHYVSFIGDTHPVFHGSVVKAIASGMRAYPHILKSLGAERLARRGDAAEYAEFRAQMQDRLNARVVKVQRHTPSVVELTIRAPQAAAKFQPGQFFRLQNFETFSALAGETRLQTEAIAVLGAGADAETGEISVMLLEQGASTKLAARLQPGDAVALMGPTGVKARMYDGGETVLLIGGRLGAAVARTLGKKLRQAGNRVLYIAGFREAAEVYCQDELEDAADAILWITEQAPAVTPRRPQDRAVAGDFLDILTRYAGGEWGEPAIPLQQVTKVQIVGSPRLARLIQQARHGALQSYFQHSPAFTASVHGPMQCMLKGVCAQCLQWQIDPASGQRTKAVFACSWQDQPLDIVDLDNLDERLSQNRLQEHLSDLWLEHVTAG